MRLFQSAVVDTALPFSGDFTALVVGKTGAGKSTLLNILFSFFRGGTAENPKVAIPTAFHDVTEPEGRLNREAARCKRSQAQTQECVTYTLQQPQSQVGHWAVDSSPRNMDRFVVFLVALCVLSFVSDSPLFTLLTHLVLVIRVVWSKMKSTCRKFSVLLLKLNRSMLSSLFLMVCICLPGYIVFKCDLLLCVKGNGDRGSRKKNIMASMYFFFLFILLLFLLTF